MLWASAHFAFAREGVSYDMDDMYSTHSRTAIAQERVEIAQSQAAVQEQRMAQWAAILGLEVDEMAREDEAFDTPFGAKLRALSAGEYTLPDSYFEYSYNNEYSDLLLELAQYDPALYNASIDYRGELSIEPKYVNSIYGTWGDPYYDHYSWYYGYPPTLYLPSPHRYYSSWSFYNPYNPWWWSGYGGYYGWDFGYYYGFYRPYYHHPYRPPYRPSYRPSVSFKKQGRTIVSGAKKYSTPASRGTTTSNTTKSRNPNGSTVGSSSTPSRGGYNRSTSTSSRSSSSSSSSSSRSSGGSAPSSAPSMRTNSIGR